MKRFIQLLSLSFLVFVAHCLASFAQSHILDPGVPYVARQFVSKGDLFDLSGSEYHSFIITIHKDHTASGVYMVGTHEYEETDAFKVSMTGHWRNTSMYDRAVVEIELEYHDGNTDLSYTIYVDANHNAYVGDLNNNPAELKSYAEILAEKKREEEAAARRDSLKIACASLMGKSQALYELVDLGLRVRWANLNLSSLPSNDWGKSRQSALAARVFENQLDLIGDVIHSAWEKREKPSDMKLYSYYKNDRGIIDILFFKDPDSDYVAGGAKHGEPCMNHYYKNSHIVEECLSFSLKQNPNPTLKTMQSEEEWIDKYVKMGHYPTKSEWQELMDNCTVSGVETLPERSDSIYLAYNDLFWHSLDKYEELRMLRLTSKLNSNSIVLPFIAGEGTNYATSQYLSTDPREVTCVHVDSTGLSFVEVRRDTHIAHRCVFGTINMEALEKDIQLARANYANSPYVKEQEELKNEYENKALKGMLSIGAPSITFKESDYSGRRYVEIKAPITAGTITDNSSVLVAVDYGSDIIFDEATIKKARGEVPAHIICTIKLNEKSRGGRPIRQHSVFIFSDNIKNNPTDKTIKNEGIFKDFLRTFGYQYDNDSGFNNCYEIETERRIIATPTTFFSLDENNTIKYISGPSTPQIGAPKILSIGTPKGKAPLYYNDIEAGFTINECSSPFELPRIQSFDLIVLDGEKSIKTKYIETSGDTRKYSIKKLTTGTPYIFVGSAVDQFGSEYKTRIQITLNPDGTVSSESLK